VVNAKAVPSGGFDVLAVIPIEVAASAPETGFALDDGTRLTLEALPYALEDETA
jgi:hypothetical protein